MHDYIALVCEIASGLYALLTIVNTVAHAFGHDAAWLEKTRAVAGDVAALKKPKATP